ncbi:MAG: hypothetical protein SCM96_13540, partial [Acidobacteriota bacterium]|nr:hypothetical protein [Acidobacteriota bacterium]
MNKEPRLFEPGEDLERIWLERAGPDLLAALRRIFDPTFANSFIGNSELIVYHDDSSYLGVVPKWPQDQASGPLGARVRCSPGG